MSIKSKILRFGHYGPDSYEKRGITAVDITFRQSIVPFSFVTLFFFLWGFSYGLLDTLNAHFQSLLNISQMTSYYLQVAYFGGYFVCPPTFAAWVLKKYGYRITFVCGLLIFGVASFMFWPCAKYEVFGGFCGVMFVVGCGLSTLETSANPYASLLGPAKHMELRLNFAQAFNGIGSVVAPAILSHAFFKGDNVDDLGTVQWVYLAIGVFVLILAFCFMFVIDLPEASDDDLHRIMEVADGIYDDSKPLWKMYPLFWACLAQFTYVGGQVAIASSYINYCFYNADIDRSMGSNYLSIAQSIYTVGRFLTVVLLRYIGPQYIFTVCIVCCGIFAAAAAGATGRAGVACYMIIFFFESACYSTIFGMGIRGLGRHTKTGSSLIVMSISGAMLFSPLTGVVADSSLANSHRLLMIVPMIGYFISSTYGFFQIYAHRKLDKIKKEEAKVLDLEASNSYVFEEKEASSFVENINETSSR